MFDSEARRKRAEIMFFGPDDNGSVVYPTLFSGGRPIEPEEREKFIEEQVAAADGPRFVAIVTGVSALVMIGALIFMITANWLPGALLGVLSIVVLVIHNRMARPLYYEIKSRPIVAPKRNRAQIRAVRAQTTSWWLIGLFVFWVIHPSLRFFPNPPSFTDEPFFWIFMTVLIPFAVFFLPGIIIEKIRMRNRAA